MVRVGSNVPRFGGRAWDKFSAAGRMIYFPVLVAENLLPKEPHPQEVGMVDAHDDFCDTVLTAMAWAVVAVREKVHFCQQ